MLWILALVTPYVVFVLLLLLSLCLAPPEGSPEEHQDLQEFRNQQRPRWLDTLEQEQRSGQHHHDVEASNNSNQQQGPSTREMNDSRVVFVTSHLHSHQLQKGESARNLSAALFVEQSPETESIKSSGISNEQPQCGRFTLWWFGVESSVLSSVPSMRASVRSVISMSKPECSICLQKYHEGETIAWAKTDDCNHMYHQECIVEWLASHDECPLCRTNLLQGAHHDDD